MSKRRRTNDNKVAVNHINKDDDDDDDDKYDHKNSSMKYSIKQEVDVLDDKNVNIDTIINDDYMPIQSTNPITIDDMNNNKSNDRNNNDDDTEQHQSIALRQLQSFGSIFDIQTDTTSSSTTYRKKQSSLMNTDSSSVLVILPGNIQLHNNNIKNLNTSNHHQQDNDQHKQKQETEFVTIGRIEGFHNIINGTNDNVPTPNNLTLTLGGNCCDINSTTNHDMNQNHTSLLSSNNCNDDEVTEHIPSKEMSSSSVTTSAIQPTIVLHGRSIPTKTTFVLLHVTTPSSIKTTKTTTSNKNKKQQQSNQPKVTCKGLYQNVIVFGEGKVVVPTSTSSTEKAETILSDMINHNADMHTTNEDDILLYNNCTNKRNHINTTKDVDSNNTNIDTTIKIVKNTTGTSTTTIPQENNLYNHDNDDDEVIILHPEPNDKDDDEVIILQPEPQQNYNDDTINKNTNKKQKLSTNKSFDDVEDNNHTKNVLIQNEIQQQSLTRSNQKRTRRHPQPESQHNTFESIEVKSEYDDMLQHEDQIMMNKRKLPNNTSSIMSPPTPSPTRIVTKGKHTLSVLETESYIDKESSNKSNSKVLNTKTIATSLQPTSPQPTSPQPKSSHSRIKSSSMSITTTTTPSSNRTSRRRRPISTNKIKKVDFDDDDEFAFLGE